ncbi:MAG TPA: clostripain-related cysteine peptidase [Ruminococcus sp.]|nr:clostripain-related cysteine peptidase [Ruminococcus sp.]
MDPKQNRPKAREKKVTEGGKGARRRGEGLGTGTVGSADHSAEIQTGGSTAKRAAAGGGGLAIIAILAMLLFKGGGLGSLLGGGGGGGGSDDTSSGGYIASGETDVDTSVASGSRAKRTQILGNNQDKITLMVYMCGTDLESKYGMASSDMEEMRQASTSFGDNINLIVYTGGCKAWKTSSISSSVNQIYRISGGQITRLVSDDGSKAMTDPDNLTSFIKYCSKNYPANRNQLILWDHGGGSVSGYGYDEKNQKSGSMSLAGISKALKNAGVTFDFVGFDACLMATAETALMLNDYADYLIASEETEPGIGWYYTNWLNKIAKDTSTPTIEIGKNIVDDFVTECGKKCKGQKTTLSVIDLAEFANTVPSDLSAFSKSITTKINNKEYQEISDARYKTREFASSSRIDQVDLVNLAENMGTSEGEALKKSIKNAVKYNRTSSNMTNAHGVSIYFPYQRTSYVDTACSTYNQIGMDSEYANCIRQFAQLETSGQIAAGGSSSPLGSLFGGGASSGSSGSADMIGQLLGAFLGGGSSGRSIAGLDSSNTAFMDGADSSDTTEYLSEHYFDASNLVWTEEDGKYILDLPDGQWDMIHAVDKNVFLDDGNGYIDLGLDNTFTYNDDADLVADTDRNWLSINGQPVAYYHTDTTDYDGDDVITGYVPAFLNGERVKVIIVFDKDNKDGYIAGAEPAYVNGETDTVAKSMTELNVGDTLEFICDYYTYDKEYQDTYYLGEPMKVTENMQISNTDIGDGEIHIMYLVTDIYNQQYWTEAIVK